MHSRRCRGVEIVTPDDRGEVPALYVGAELRSAARWHRRCSLLCPEEAAMGTGRTLGIVVVAVALFASSGLARAQTDDRTKRAGVMVLAIGVPAGLGLGLASVGFHAMCVQHGGFMFRPDCDWTTAMMAVSFGAAGISVLVGTLMVTRAGKKSVAARASGPVPRLEAAVAPGGGQLTATWTF